MYHIYPELHHHISSVYMPISIQIKLTSGLIIISPVYMRHTWIQINSVNCFNPIVMGSVTVKTCPIC